MASLLICEMAADCKALCDFVPEGIAAELGNAEGVLAALRKRGITNANELRSSKGRLTNRGRYAKVVIDLYSFVTRAIVGMMRGQWSESATARSIYGC